MWPNCVFHWWKSVYLLTQIFVVHKNKKDNFLLTLVDECLLKYITAIFNVVFSTINKSLRQPCASIISACDAPLCLWSLVMPYAGHPNKHNFSNPIQNVFSGLTIDNWSLALSPILRTVCNNATWCIKRSLLWFTRFDI